jgi:DNA-binding CsgD family transcriptional regulator
MSEVERLKSMGVEVDAATVEKMKDPLWAVKSGLGYQHLSDDSVYLSRHRALSEARDFTNRSELIDWLKLAIRPVFPFESALLVFGRIDDADKDGEASKQGQITVVDTINIDMPESYMAYVDLPNHKMHSPVLSSWHERHTAMVLHASDIKVEPDSHEWHKEFVRAGFKDVVIDGVYDDKTNEITLIKLYNCSRKTSTGASFALSLFNAKVASCVHHTWRRIAEHEAEARRRLPAFVELLTPKEMIVLQWIKMGKTNPEIGSILNNSPTTIKTHVEHILKKLQVPNRTTLASMAIELPS